MVLVRRGPLAITNKSAGSDMSAGSTIRIWKGYDYLSFAPSYLYLFRLPPRCNCRNCLSAYEFACSYCSARVLAKGFDPLAIRREKRQHDELNPSTSARATTFITRQIFDDILSIPLPPPICPARA